MYSDNYIQLGLIIIVNERDTFLMTFADPINESTNSNSSINLAGDTSEVHSHSKSQSQCKKHNPQITIQCSCVHSFQ